ERERRRGRDCAQLEAVALALRPFGAQPPVVDVHADDVPNAGALAPGRRQHALAAADVEDGRRRREVEQLVERTTEAGHEAARRRVAGGVLGVEVARPGGGAHGPTPSPFRPPFSWCEGGTPSASSMRRARSSVRWVSTRWA